MQTKKRRRSNGLETGGRARRKRKEKREVKNTEGSACREDRKRKSERE